MMIILRIYTLFGEENRGLNTQDSNMDLAIVPLSNNDNSLAGTPNEDKKLVNIGRRWVNWGAIVEYLKAMKLEFVPSKS